LFGARGLEQAGFNLVLLGGVAAEPTPGRMQVSQATRTNKREGQINNGEKML